MSLRNEPKKKGFLIRKLRSFYEHRALWMYLFYDEARKKGLKPESFVPQAIHRCGLYHGFRTLSGREDAASQAQLSSGGSLTILKKKQFVFPGPLIFEMKFLNITDDNFEVDFHYCPLVSAWKKQGASDEECDRLCDWAMEGDRGIAEAFGCDLELPKTIAKGDGICQIRIKRKK